MVSVQEVVEVWDLVVDVDDDAHDLLLQMNSNHRNYRRSLQLDLFRGDTKAALSGTFGTFWSKVRGFTSFRKLL